jgi:hypothetical protein
MNLVDPLHDRNLKVPKRMLLRPIYAYQSSLLPNDSSKSTLARMVDSEIFSECINTAQICLSLLITFCLIFTHTSRFNTL